MTSTINCIEIDTMRGSIIHRLFGRRETAGYEPYSTAKLYVITALASYLPLVILAWLGDVPLAHQTAGVRLPLLYDANTAWMCLASLPTLLILTVRDQRVLAHALEHVQHDGVVRPRPGALDRLKNRYVTLFARLNVWSQIVGVVVGVVVAGLNYRTMSDPSLATWGAPSGMLQPAGYLLLVVIALFYSVAAIYIARSAGIVVFLWALVGDTEVDLLPLHPDGCGGLRPVGQLGLRNQYALTVFGINVIFLWYVATVFLGHTDAMQLLVALGAGAYVIVGPLVFLGPLLPFRGGMLDAKRRLLQPIATRLRAELTEIEEHLGTKGFSKSDEELIDRLQKLGSMIDSLPVWPFDARTVRRFLTAFVLPILGVVGVPLIEMVMRSGLHIVG